MRLNSFIAGPVNDLYRISVVHLHSWENLTMLVRAWKEMSQLISGNALEKNGTLMIQMVDLYYKQPRLMPR